ncbi:retinol dehydrogenase 12-like [Stomoxys calcitrans]|uniref:retinol dehydrogenase 12-like n=1 Tax=Stomoxys calcitrans TaxID=35570 RepID=UPI0027E274E7|nr:retinol dehydrogenase 12-like [Stomoxys calcitrans]
MGVAEVLDQTLCDYVSTLRFSALFFSILSGLCLIFTLVIFNLWKWKEGPTYEKNNRIDGKVVIVTGCNTGIGKETALELARRGARVYMACRDSQKCEEARQEIMEISGNQNVFNRTLDLSSLKSVRKFAQDFKEEEQRLDILINNAGIMATPRKLTVDGYEQQFAVNHLGHFLLTNLLLERLKAAAPSRVVVVSSWMYAIGNIQKEDINSEKSYNDFRAYSQSKLANVLFTHKLAQMLHGSGVAVNCLHPGSVQTELFRNNSFLGFFSRLGKICLRSTKGGAQTSLFLALDPQMAQKTGGYYDRMTLQTVVAKARDDEMADWLWRQSAKMVGLQEGA